MADLMAYLPAANKLASKDVIALFEGIDDTHETGQRKASAICFYMKSEVDIIANILTVIKPECRKFYLDELNKKLIRIFHEVSAHF